MKGRRLLTLAVLAFVVACEDHKAPTDPAGLKAPSDPSMLISDGAHGGNPDFFFLPPLLPNPSTSPNYEVGRANTTLASALTVEICELLTSPVNEQGLPVVTDCIAGPPLKKFPAGTVKLADSGADGFYMAQWKPAESNLVLSKYYRIKVLIEGSTAPLGAADLDPVANQKELKNVRTGELIPLTADGTLLIKFRIENAGGPPVCGVAALCTTTVVTNNSPTGSTIVTVDGGSGAVAGAQFPNGWLPPGGPQSVVVTIASVNTGISDLVAGTETIPCHAGLGLQQFRGCFQFTTTPRLTPIDESGAQFAIPVTVAVCYVLQGTGDPREKFAEMWASGPNEPPHPLPDASDFGILAANTRDCSSNVIGLNNSKGISGLASASWRKLKSGLGGFFGVKTAYAVDAGLGGFISEFSNVGPVLSAEIDPVGSTELTVAGGGAVLPSVRIVGSNHHDGEHHNETGLGGLPVAWVASAGTLGIPGTQGGTTQLTNATNTLPIDPQDPQSGGGFASVNWTVPTAPGTYTLTATGAATGGPVVFTATVPASAIGLTSTERRMLSMQTGATIPMSVLGNAAAASWASSAPQKIAVTQAGIVTAVVGGENIQGGDNSVITSVLSTGNPGPTLLADSFLFDIFPRVTTLVWNPVAGAVSYHVVTEFGNASETNPFCTVPSECGIWTEQGLGTTTTNLTTFTFEFVGAQPGRWRVFALNAAGAVISTSAYVYFAYLI
jgi:hypothetical protein